VVQGVCFEKRWGTVQIPSSGLIPGLGGAPLCEKFGRLFDLAETKSSTVVEMFSSGWEVSGEAWVWRRRC
jgi:hypothetical protein